jgi:hypothetical protein
MAKYLARNRWAILAVACLGVAVLPATLLWNAVRPRPWDERTLRVHFESVRYEAAGLVFTYSVENRAWRPLRLVPNETEIRLLTASDHIPAGYPNFAPFFLEGHSTQRVELRIELPGDPPQSAREWRSDENTRSVLQQSVPGITADDPAGPPLPLAGSLAASALPAEIPEPEEVIEDALRDLDGFELVNATKGVRLLFPRGW